VDIGGGATITYSPHDILPRHVLVSVPGGPAHVWLSAEQVDQLHALVHQDDE
jgi:hypothetical protein